VERELNRARESLEAATQLFPLGAEANELLALTRPKTLQDHPDQFV